MTLDRAIELVRGVAGWSGLVAAALFAYQGARIAMEVRGTRRPVAVESAAPAEEHDLLGPGTDGEEAPEQDVDVEEATMVFVLPEESDGGPTAEQEPLAVVASDAGPPDAGPLLASDVTPVRVRLRVRGSATIGARVTVDGLEAGRVPLDAEVECFRGATVVVQVSAPGYRSVVERIRCRDGGRFDVGGSLARWN